MRLGVDTSDSNPNLTGNVGFPQTADDPTLASVTYLDLSGCTLRNGQECREAVSSDDFNVNGEPFLRPMSRGGQ